MKRVRDFGWFGCAAMMGLFLPGMPQRCEGGWTPPGAGGSGGAAGGEGTIAGATSRGGTAASTGGSPAAGSGATAGQSCGGSLTPLCGNGCVEPGEECDGGTANGSAQPCSATCLLVCDGAPIRVDPSAASNGSGCDWLHPANQIQGAINAQATRGGRDIWIIQGEFGLPASSGNITVPSNIRLRGGFRRDDSVGGVTLLRGTGAGPLLTINSATDVSLEHLRISDGDPAFIIQSSRNVSLRDVVVEHGEDYTNNSLAISGSEVRIESSSLSYPQNGNGLLITGSDVTIIDSSLDSAAISSLSPKLRAQSSRLLLQRARSLRGIVIDEGADALIVESSLPNTHAPGAALHVYGRAAAVGTDFGQGWGFAGLAVEGSALVFDSSFVRLHSTGLRGNYPAAWAIAGSGSLEVSLSTFIGGSCSYSRSTPCPAIEAGAVNNSFFVYDASVGPVTTGGPYAPESLVVLNGTMPPSNCAIAESGAAYELSSNGMSGPYPCADRGDATLLAESHQRLLGYAAPFLVAPFYANLDRYLASDFWQTQTVLRNSCGDANPPDPARHFVCAI